MFEQHTRIIIIKQNQQNMKEEMKNDVRFSPRNGKREEKLQSYGGNVCVCVFVCFGVRLPRKVKKRI